jgi:hypothetical protein
MLKRKSKKVIKNAGSMAQVVEHCLASNSNPSIPKKKERKSKKK